MAVTSQRASNRLGFGVLAGLALLALPILIRPFGGDQSLYLLMADRLRHGAVLYRDVWDVKQPGLPFFYMLASALAGGSSAGPHVAEFSLLLAFAFVLQRAVPVRSSALKVVSPIVVLAPYLIDSRVGDLTQLEFLVGLPMFMCLWCTSNPHAQHSTRPWALIAGAGLSAGIVGYFKLAYLPIPLAMWFVAELHRDAALRRKLIRSSQFIGWLLLSWAPLVVYTLHFHLWRDLYDTWFVFPRSMTSLGGRPASRLLISVVSIAAVLAPLLFLAILGAARRVRQRRFNTWTTNCFVWLIVAGFGVLVQNWWRYHFYIFLVPVGLLALDAIDSGMSPHETSRAASKAFTIVVGALCLIPIVDGRELWRHLGQSHLALEQNARGRFQTREDEYRAKVAAELAPRRTIKGPIGVFYFGSPELQRAAGDPLITAVHGWSPEFYSTAIWERLSAELLRAQPSAVYVDSFSAPFVHGRGRLVQDWLERSFRFRARTPDGTWYFSSPLPSTPAAK